MRRSQDLAIFVPTTTTTTTTTMTDIQTDYFTPAVAACMRGNNIIIGGWLRKSQPLLFPFPLFAHKVLKPLTLLSIFSKGALKSPNSFFPYLHHCFQQSDVSTTSVRHDCAAIFGCTYLTVRRMLIHKHTDLVLQMTGIVILWSQLYSVFLWFCTIK